MNRRHHDRFDHRKDREERNERYPENIKKYSKTSILLKSTVFMLFIVFVTLIAAYFLVKNRMHGSSNKAVTNCAKVKVIKASKEIEKIEVQSGVITLLTKIDKNNHQEIIRLDAACGTELNRVTIESL